MDNEQNNYLTMRNACTVSAEYVSHKMFSSKSLQKIIINY